MNTKAMYPRADVNPKDKAGINWLRQYAKAAYADAEQMSNSIFWKAAKQYQELRDTAMGKQSVDKYKPLLGVEEGADASHLSIDWSTRPIGSKFRDIAISKVLQREFHINATPIDPMAKSEMDKYYAGMKAKLLMRQHAQQLGLQSMMQMPAMQLEANDPEDMDELEMKMQYSIKLNVAIEAEMGIQLVLFQNELEKHRKKVVEDLFDIGVGGYKEWIDDDGQVGLRAVLPDNLITNFCRKADFADMVHVGEIIEVPLSEISQFFEASEMEEIAGCNAGKFGNPLFMGDNSVYNMGFDGFKCQVLDMEIISDDTIVIEKRVDARGNIQAGRAKWEKKSSQAKVVINGKEQPKFTPKTITNVYKVKWVVGTDYCYDLGLAFNMKREPDKKLMGRTSLSYHLLAYSFDNMKTQSMMLRLRPLIDDYHMTHYKLQNLKNRMIPNGWAIDLDALESVSLSKGGEDMQPQAVLDMMFQTGILVYRGSSLDNTNPNRKPVEPIQNTYAQELGALYNELQRIVQEMRDMTGLNELTDGSTPSDRMLNGVASLANQSTNNALYPIVQADKALLEKLSKGILQRLQIAVKQGKVQGIVKSLGDGFVKHIEVTNAIAPHVWGIMIQDKPTDEERQMLLQQLNLKDAQGQLDPEDVVTVYNIQNLKEARQYLAWKVKKRQKDQQQQAMMMQQQNTQSQIQSAQAAEQAKQQTLMLASKLKKEEIELTMQWEYKIAQLKTHSAENITAATHENHLVKQAMGDDSRESIAAMGGQQNAAAAPTDASAILGAAPAPQPDAGGMQGQDPSQEQQPPMGDPEEAGEQPGQPDEME